MARKNNHQGEPLSLSTEDMKERWYTAGEGAKKLSETSGRPVRPSYLSKLGSLGKIRTFKVHDRLVLYSKEDVDAYRVEDRGTKSGQAKREGKTGPTVREARAQKKEPSAA